MPVPLQVPPIVLAASTVNWTGAQSLQLKATLSICAKSISNKLISIKTESPHCPAFPYQIVSIPDAVAKLGS